MFNWLLKILGSRAKSNAVKNNTRETQSKEDFDRFGSNTNSLMIVEDVFFISGRGTVVTGKISSGSFFLENEVKISDSSGNMKFNSILKGIETFRKLVKIATVGENVGMLLDNVNKDQVERGDRITRD